MPYFDFGGESLGFCRVVLTAVPQHQCQIEARAFRDLEELDVVGLLLVLKMLGAGLGKSMLDLRSVIVVTVLVSSCCMSRW